MTQATLVRRSLSLEWITASEFSPYGQLITATSDDKVFDYRDAQLDLSQGIPRFFLMRLKHRGRDFHRITRHERCTQCMGSRANKDWFMVVAPPDPMMTKPDVSATHAFRIPGDCFIKLHVGTWHAGPYFDHDFVDFYNLELSDTNVTDHNTYDFRQTENIEWRIV